MPENNKEQHRHVLKGGSVVECLEFLILIWRGGSSLLLLLCLTVDLHAGCCSPLSKHHTPTCCTQLDPLLGAAESEGEGDSSSLRDLEGRLH